MTPKRKRATAAAVAQGVSSMQLYRTSLEKSTAIDEILAGLVFSLASPRVMRHEQSGVLSTIDGLIRLKIDTGLLRGGKR